jgi:hypothetical protein
MKLKVHIKAPLEGGKGDVSPSLSIELHFYSGSIK